MNIIANCYETQGRQASKYLLHVLEWSITRSIAKKIKEATQGPVQAKWPNNSSATSKTPRFKMSMKEEGPTLVHLTQAKVKEFILILYFGIIYVLFQSNGSPNRIGSCPTPFKWLQTFF